MPIIKDRDFTFENSNGIRYRVKLNTTAGTGIARKITGTNSRGDGPVLTGNGTTITPVALTIDAGSQVMSRTCHESRLEHAAIYNTGQRLDAILNAAS